jgi:hypothetical protein
MSFFKNTRSRNVAFAVFAVVGGVVLTVSVAAAATTISTNIQTDGTLSVTGQSVLNGNTGVGTSTPGANLVVNGTTGQNLLQVATSTNQNIFTIDQNGYVSIGLAPGDVTPLEVASNNAIAPATFKSTLTLTDTTPNSSTLAGAGSGIRFRAQTNFGNTTIAGIWAETAGANTSGNLFFTARSSGGSTAPTMVLTSAGSLGVGTSTPIANFQVANGSNATTTAEFGSSGQNKGSCLKLYRTDGSAIYAYVAAGATTFTLTTTACANVSNF